MNTWDLAELVQGGAIQTVISTFPALSWADSMHGSSASATGSITGILKLLSEVWRSFQVKKDR